MQQLRALRDNAGFYWIAMLTPPSPRLISAARTLLLLGLFVLSAALFRWALFRTYPGDFQELDAAMVKQAFGVGLRFDLSMTALMAGLPLMALHMPFQWSNGKRWHSTWHWLAFAMLLAFVFMMAADLIYFGNVHRHVGSEINTLSNDMGSMVGIAVRQYGMALLAFVAGALLLAWIWRHLFTLPQSGQKPLWLRIAYVPVVLFFILLIGRSGVDGKPISVGDAFFSNNPAQGYLALNGAFSMSRALMESPPPLREFVPEAQAIAMAHTYLAGDDPVFTTPGYPIFRSMHPATVKPRPNVVVLMLESWGAQHIDALRRLREQPALGVTPHFDALAAQGRLYSRFYANGQRSILGAESILASQPTFPAMPFLGEGIEQNRQSFLGELARSQGYETYFLQSSERASLRFDVIAARTGFTTYKGAEDIPNTLFPPKAADTWGTWDHNTFAAAHQLFAAARKPFLGFVFTSSTHAPWLIPDEKFKKFTGGSDREAFRNSLLYADWALGELINAAKKAGYFDNTLFVLVADHADEFAENTDVVPNLYHVPLLIVGPGVKPGIDERIGSQFDIVPTLIELCGWQVDYAGWGRSLLDDRRMDARASLGVRGETLDWIGTNGWVSHNLEKRLGRRPGMSAHDVEQMQQQLLATYQLAAKLQSTNHIQPPPR